MNRIGRFLLITIVRGVLFLVPIVLIALAAEKGYELLRRFFRPVARLLPESRILGVVTEDLITILAIMLVFLISGLFVATSQGQLLSGRLEREVLYRIPGYLLVRGATWGYLGLDSEHPVTPVLVAMEEGWAFGLLVERAPSGFCTVFLPGSPTPTSGDVRIFEEDRVQVLDTPIIGLIGCLTRSGVGAGKLAAPVLREWIQPIDDDDPKPSGDPQD